MQAVPALRGAPVKEEPPVTGRHPPLQSSPSTGMPPKPEPAGIGGWMQAWMQPQDPGLARRKSIPSICMQALSHLACRDRGKLRDPLVGWGGLGMVS